MINKNGKSEKKEKNETKVSGRREPVSGVYIPSDEEVEQKREWSISKKL